MVLSRARKDIKINREGQNQYVDFLSFSILRYMLLAVMFFITLLCWHRPHHFQDDRFKPGKENLRL